jgi:hypothetical protein
MTFDFRSMVWRFWFRMNVDRGRGKASWAQSMMEGVELSSALHSFCWHANHSQILFRAMRFHLPRLAG